MSDKKDEAAKEIDPTKVDPSEYKNIPGNQTGQGRGDPRAEQHAQEVKKQKQRDSR
jgi:hypothetical protein